jgi:hypothetical protein
MEGALGVSVKVSCPACGGPIVFKVGSAIVAICEYCHSAVARGDRHVEDLGKVADLVDTGAVLEVGLKGRFEGVPFELTGRAQLGHEAGGVWDEWYAAFSDGRWGWLAEAQGRYYLTFQHPSKRSASLPPLERLKLGQPLQLDSGSPPLLVAEKGEARAVSAEGEIPYRLVPGATYSYADLSGKKREFATIDYSDDPPLVFLGYELTLDELGIPETRRQAEHAAREVQGVHLSCPQCGGALELRAPDRTEHVGCPNCGALLDVTHGQLLFLQALGLHKPIIPIGSTGKFNDHVFTLIGYLKRQVEVDRIKYTWEEFLLYHPHEGFRWLVRSEDHWSFVEPLAPGQVSCTDRRAEFQGRQFKIFQKNMASVRYILGEFYWKVTQGEQVLAADFIHPPQMLSREIAKAGHSSEVSWSLGTYWPVRDVERAFDLKEHLPRPALTSVAPNQPFLYKQVYSSWVILTGVALLIGLFFMARGAGRQVFSNSYHLQQTKMDEQAQVFFSEPFELRPRENVAITASASLNNNWLDIEGDLINDETNQVQPFSLPLEYYSGSDSDGPWTEGSREGSVHVSALPAGKYTLRLEFQTQKGSVPLQVNVRVQQAVARAPYFLLTLGALAAIPLCVAIYHFIFERRRWEDSEYSPFHSG